jgi:hypothetical protein
MVELLALGGTLALAFAASWVDAQRRRTARRSLEQYAFSRLHRFAEGRARQGPRTWGSQANVAFTIDFCKVGGELRTRVCAPATRGGHGPRVRIAQRSRAARFEDAYAVDGVEAGVASSCATALETLSRRSAVVLASDGTRITLTWRGIETDPAVLDAAVVAVVAAATWHDPERPYR